MKHTLALAMILISTSHLSAADIVLDWNSTLREAIQTDRTKTDPGWSSRSMGMMGGAIYDSLMAIDRTHRPFHVDTSAAATTSKEAAISQAAWRVLTNTYPLQSATFDAALASRLATIPDGPDKAAGIALGNSVAEQYVTWRATDGANNTVPYDLNPAPGHWRPDPLHPAQQAWGPAWGSVSPFTMSSSEQFAPPHVPDMTSQAYADAFNEVKMYGAKNSVARTADQTQLAVFWGYDRAGMGPPPVIYNAHVSQIAQQTANSMEDNARLFAMTMVAQADASIAAWDAKYVDDFWRPITGIREADTDGNPLTEADPTWEPLGAPGGGVVDDFTPPFPAYVSGHATFGGAVFTALAHFYGDDAMHFELTSQELPGVVRSFDHFSEAAEENGRSRVYLGIHWSFDDTEGRILGGKVADWVAANHFAAVPEPSSLLLAAIGLLGAIAARRRMTRTQNSCVFTSSRGQRPKG